jgi:xylulose-5-phosphate/fructose-6-phosphate phosphoketolase
VRDGAVLPVLHLNGYKIANPTVLARMPEEELLELLRGYGHEPHVVAGDDPAQVHELLAGRSTAAWTTSRRSAGAPARTASARARAGP